MKKEQEPTESLGDFGGEPEKGGPHRGQAFDAAVAEREAKAKRPVADKAVQGPEASK